MFKFFRKKYMDWEEYQNRIGFLELFYWQQSIRKNNLKVKR